MAFMVYPPYFNTGCRRGGSHPHRHPHYVASFVVHAEPILDRTRSLCCRFAQIVNRIVRMLMCIVVTSQAQTIDHAASHAH